MAFCAQCGAQLAAGSGFCGSCGASASGQSVTPSTGAAVQPAPSANTTTGTGMANNGAACLSYLLGWITGLIFLLLDPYKNDKFVRFHAFQSIFLDVAFIAAWIGLWIVGFVLTLISRGLFAPLMFLIWMVVLFGFIGLRIYMMVKAYGNQQVKLPFIGDFAAKQAGN